MRWQRMGAITVALSIAAAVGGVGAHVVAGTDAVGPAAFTSVTPCRLVDTRQGAGVRVDDRTIRLQITGRCGVPADAPAVALTVVATQAGSAGYVTAYPSASTPPLASVLNYDAGDTRANSTVLALSEQGQIDLYALG